MHCEEQCLQGVRPGVGGLGVGEGLPVLGPVPGSADGCARVLTHPQGMSPVSLHFHQNLPCTDILAFADERCEMPSSFYMYNS